MRTMKYAEIYSVQIRGTDRFEWRWRADDARHQSARCFAFYFDCLEDARCSGYQVPLEHASGLTAPGATAGRNMK